MGGGAGPSSSRLAMVPELPVADWLWCRGARVSLTSCPAGRWVQLSGSRGLNLPVLCRSSVRGVAEGNVDTWKEVLGAPRSGVHP